MLAERKHKMKWSPNPCGNLWAKDSSKFGQKILEKFGWSPGKGLGVNEQGIVDPVRLKCNSTQKGLGYERGKKVEIFQHQEEFNSILSNLNSSNCGSDSKESCPSLEQTSKNCKTRVHYHKFTRGKDLSRYSEKDLSCILGVVSALENTIVSSNTTSSKLEEKEEMWEPAQIDSQCNKTDDKNESEIEPDNEKKKKKRKRKYENIDDLPVNDKSNSSNKINELETCQIKIDSGFEEQSINLNESSSKKTKRKRKYGNIDDNTLVNSDECLNLEACQIQTESRFEEQSLNILSENSSNKKKRKRGVKSTLEEEPVEDPKIKAEIEQTPSNEVAQENHNEDFSNKISKKKKKKHKKNK